MSFEVLSDHEFEMLVGDLLGAREGCVFEVFARGPDGGVDLRHVDPSGTTVAQCKHMERSSIGQLRAAAEFEVARWDLRQDDRPNTYIFATSQQLTPRRKSEIAELIRSVGKDRSEVLSGNDIATLLRTFPAVQRGHVKLWLSNAEQLSMILNSGVSTRSQSLLGDIKEHLATYVTTASFDFAKQQLLADRVIVISGPPGMGKSTLAKVLAADAATDGFEIVVVSEDADEADRVFATDKRQLFYYDDFLGTNILEDRIAKNEDKRLADLMRRCAQSQDHLLIMTTREYILQQALDWYEELARAGIPVRKYLLELSTYTRYEKAQILISHVKASQVIDKRALISILQKQRYQKIIDHPNYNPRIIEYVTGRSFYRLERDDLGDYFGFVMKSLGDPNIVWSRAFESQIDDRARALIIAVSVADRCSTWPLISSLYHRLCELSAVTQIGKSPMDVMRMLEDSFLKSSYSRGTTTIQLANPGIGDLVAGWLSRNHPATMIAILAAERIEQLDWLVDRVVPSVYQHSEDTYGACADAIMRLWDIPRSPKVSQYETTDAWTLTRLSLAIKILRLDSSPSSYAEWVQQELDQGASDVRVQPLFPLLAARVVREAAECGLSPTQLAQVVLELLIDEAFYLDAWESILQIRDAVPDCISPVEAEEMKAQCSAWATDELQIDVDFFKDIGDLEDILEVCAEFGATVAEESVKHAYRRLGASDEMDEGLRVRKFSYRGNTAQQSDEEELIQQLMVDALRKKSAQAE